MCFNMTYIISVMSWKKLEYTEKTTNLMPILVIIIRPFGFLGP